MEEFNLNIIARLVALNERTRRTWAHSHNKSFYVPASLKGEQVRDSRESTPFQDDDEGGPCADETEPELRIPLNSRPKDMSKGWVFGSDETSCDVYCGAGNNVRNYGIGGQTFSLTISKQGHVILEHINNQNLMEVEYQPQKAGKRREFTWIMFPKCKRIVVTSARQLKFEVIVTKPQAHTKLYLQLRAQFLKDVEKSMQSIPSLNLRPRPNLQPFYYRCEGRELGRGSFGKVDVVVDASTGMEYAGKSFFGDIDLREADILAKQKHENILGYVTLSTDDGPLLVTEYLKGGNLARPWRLKDRDPWRLDQIISILVQGLRGLASLHASPNPTIHRDIKPENILVDDREREGESREAGPRIKLADFGLAREGTKCGGPAGTFAYTAPEAFIRRLNDSKLDIWSVGVSIMQLLSEGKLPMPKTAHKQGPQWCEDIINHANHNHMFYWRQNEPIWGKGRYSGQGFLWAFLANNMIRRDPKERLSAQECLDHGIIRMLQSGKIPIAEEQLKTVHISSASYSISKVNKEMDQMTSDIDIQKLFPSALGSLCDASYELVTEYSPSVEESVAWNTQGTDDSKTPVPPHKSRADKLQPVPVGLVLAENDGNGLDNQQEVEVEDPAAKQFQRPKAGAVARSRGNLQENQQEVELEDPAVKQCQRSKAGAMARSRRNLPPDMSPALNPSGLSVAGSHRVPSAHQRNGNLATKRPASPPVRRRKPSISEPASETAAAHTLMQLKGTR